MDGYSGGQQLDTLVYCQSVLSASSCKFIKLDIHIWKNSSKYLYSYNVGTVVWTFQLINFIETCLTAIVCSLKPWTKQKPINCKENKDYLSENSGQRGSYVVNLEYWKLPIHLRFEQPKLGFLNFSQISNIWLMQQHLCFLTGLALTQITIWNRSLFRMLFKWDSSLIQWYHACLFTWLVCYNNETTQHLHFWVIYIIQKPINYCAGRGKSATLLALFENWYDQIYLSSFSNCEEM